MINKIAVIGAGVIGSGWVVRFLAHNKKVIVYDTDPKLRKKVLLEVKRAWPFVKKLFNKNKLNLKNFRYVTDIKDALKNVDFIQDYTYPTVAFLDAEEIVEGDSSCVADKIRENIQGLGQELVNDVLGIGDILAYQFHKQLCRDDDEQRDLVDQFGERYKPVEELVIFGSKKKGKDNKQKGHIPV